MAVAVCRTCRAPIRWVTTKNQKAMPLDAEPNPEGNVLIIDGIAEVMKKGEQSLLHQDQQRWMPHFSTCPNWGTK